jgi:hypothetical protein
MPVGVTCAPVGVVSVQGPSWVSLPAETPIKWNDSEVLWAALPLIGALLVGAGVIYFVDRWRKKADRTQAPAEDELTHYRVLYERGELSPEEFDRLKLLLGGRLRKELNLPQPVAPKEPIPAEEKPPDPPVTDIQAG